jgi:hypothetical protein
MKILLTANFMSLKQVEGPVKCCSAVINSTPHRSSSTWGDQVCRHIQEPSIDSARLR